MVFDVDFSASTQLSDSLTAGSHSQRISCGSVAYWLPNTDRLRRGEMSSTAVEIGNSQIQISCFGRDISDEFNDKIFRILSNLFHDLIRFFSKKIIRLSFREREMTMPHFVWRLRTYTWLHPSLLRRAEKWGFVKFTTVLLRRGERGLAMNLLWS